MEDKVINQKEYLKKYISLGEDVEKKKKKKKKHKVGAKKVKVIDDDIDLSNMRSIEDDEFDIFLKGENAPQIAGIVDERGPVDFSNRKRWKIITENDEGDLTIVSDVRVSPKMTPSTNSTNSNNRMERNDKTNAKCSEDDTDLSPPRSKYSKHKRSSSNLHSRSKDNDSDFSPPRQSKNRQSKNYDSDLSPPRQSRNDDSDSSPPRRSRNNDLDLSPPRRSKNYDSDLSLPKKNTKHRTSTHTTSGRNHRSSDNRNSDSDFSPPRKHKRDVDDLYENKKDKKSSSLSASRFKEHHAPRNTSPHSSSRKVDRGQDYIDKNSSRSSRQDASRSSKDKRRREYNEDRDHKSRQYSDVSAKRKKSRWDKGTDDLERAEHSKDHEGRMTKTLDGKKAGLQDARALRKETEIHKRREMEQFSKLSKIVSGVGQAPVVRDKTGRRRNLEAEAAAEREREIQQREMNEKYSKWGKGLKQVEDHEEKLKNDLYEMSKPLARYADDADLDKELREQEKEGDPMLEYIKQKQIKEGKRKPDPPKYHGSYAPNRFGIKPGHRWDGVDRSNGYEKKWFESQNEKTAQHEEAYKWSTADM